MRAAGENCSVGRTMKCSCLQSAHISTFPRCDRVHFPFKRRMPPRTTAKVGALPHPSHVFCSHHLCGALWGVMDVTCRQVGARSLSPPPPALGQADAQTLSCCFRADGLAYSALLKNELLGAGIEKVQDPQTEDRRLQPSTPEKRSLFTVSHSAPCCPPSHTRWDGVMTSVKVTARPGRCAVGGPGLCAALSVFYHICLYPRGLLCLLQGSVCNQLSV